MDDIHIYNIMIFGGDESHPGGGSHFSGINRRPGDRGKNVDRGGEGRGGYPSPYQHRIFFRKLGASPLYINIVVFFRRLGAPLSVLTP